MGLKKKKEIHVDAIVLDVQVVEKIKSLAAVDEHNLASLILKCVQLTDGVQQIQQVKQIASLLQRLNSDLTQDPVIHGCLDILALMYISLNSKNPLKRALARSLSNIPTNLQNYIVKGLITCMQEELLIEDMCLYGKVIDGILACLDDFPLGEMTVGHMLVEVLQFLQKALCEYQVENRSFSGNHIARTQLMHNVLMAVKAAMVLIQRLQPIVKERIHRDNDTPLGEVVCELLNCFTNLLTNDDILQTVQGTSAMAIIVFVKIMLQSEEECPDLVNNLLFGAVKKDHAPEWLVRSCGNLLIPELPDLTLLFLCQGALSMLDWRIESMGQRGEQLLLNIVTFLMPISSRLKESSAVMSTSKILNLWTSSALDALDSEFCSQTLKKHLNGHSEVAGMLLEYVYAHWEHPLDAVRHQTKSLFRNLLKIHWASVKGCNTAATSDHFFLKLTADLLALDWHVKGKYASLACLVEYLGTEHLLHVDRTLPLQILEVMSEQSFAPYASDLFQTLFMNHHKSLSYSNSNGIWLDKWHETWVSPLLTLLCEGEPFQTVYIIEYSLPKLMKFSPESLSHMICFLQALYNSHSGCHVNRGALGALMTCLRTARAYGLMVITEDPTWDSLIATGLIRQALVHRHDEVRIDALGLICESHRSTEVLSLAEMHLLKFFLSYNLNTQSPSVRQQIICLMKKLFFRIQQGAQVLLREMLRKNGINSESQAEDLALSLQQYKDFLFSVCDILFEALFPGASFPTMFSVLNILRLMADIYPSSGGQSQIGFHLALAVNPARAQTLLTCFVSSFQEVKQLAFELLLKFPFPVLGLQDAQTFQQFLQVALDLSTSTYPHDCVTASYLLNLFIHQEGILPALQVCSGTKQISGDHEDDTCCDDFLEQHALAVITYLLECLNSEIQKAEKCLLQASASNPMYGRVHCINGVLQHLCLNKLSMVNKWRQVVTKLILMSYRLSDVVSPVVQSSSPEGLIPVDTDSGDAAYLQKILNEVQPRDTNDYFTHTRLLTEDQDGQTVALPSDEQCVDMKEKEGQMYAVTAQMVLVCCWRSMKEISMLLGLLCQHLPLQLTPESKGGLITAEQVKDIGQYFKFQLLQSRHRGAFELAYVGFIKLIGMLTRFRSFAGLSLQEVVQCHLIERAPPSTGAAGHDAGCSRHIVHPAVAQEVSMYIPIRITSLLYSALLSSEPKTSSTSLLKQTMTDLLSLASVSGYQDGDASIIPQVHALNILRALFRDARLGENIIPFVADGMQAAIMGFTSPVWAVRNSSTLLFSTLLTRIFGVKKGKDEHAKKNRMTGREFFTRFPVLHPFLLKQMETVSSTVDRDGGNTKLHPSLFLLLLILSKLYPSPMDGTHSALSLAPFIPFIIRCGYCPVYRSREIAARALVPFVMVDQVLSTVSSLLTSLPSIHDTDVWQNRIHGTLLQVLHLLQSFFESKHRANSSLLQELYNSDIIACIRTKNWLAKRKNPCLVTRATFIDIHIILCNYLGKFRNKDAAITGFWEDTLEIIAESEVMQDVCYTSVAPGLMQYLQSITQLIISLIVVIADHKSSCETLPDVLHQLNPSQIFCRLLQYKFYEVRVLILQALLEEEVKGYAQSLVSGMQETMITLAMEEKQPECLSKVLKLLCYLDIKMLLPRMMIYSLMNEKELLNWILKLACGPHYSTEIQNAALTFSAKMVTHLVENCQEQTEDIKPELSQWVHTVEQSCGCEQQTEMRLAAAEVLFGVTPSLLDNPQLPLGLPDTLILWNCVFTLLQDEEQLVRNSVADILREIPFPSDTYKEAAVTPSLALDLCIGALCQLLKKTGHAWPGFRTLTEWLLGEGDTERNAEDGQLVEDESLFEKGEVNLWAEKIAYIRLLKKHLVHFISEASFPSFQKAEFVQLTDVASFRAQHVDKLLLALPPVPQFCKTLEYMRLCIERERITVAQSVLNCLKEQMSVDCC
ncbi:thyroid adenoma-associated protein [Protopterus annectens]|uniref:thyroid adenoma-associated protein n=1 Tax=Protopterus annectens TaxID=7888 RepID=UPI001CFB4F29|nr:thyroid adenoma-associated protein [Protopterus annectens]